MKCKLSDIAEITMGQSPKSQYYNKNGDGMLFLQGNKTFGFKYPTFDTYTTSITKTAKAGDVIMSVRAPVGELNIAPNDFCLGRGVCSLRMKNGNQDFLYYMMKYYTRYLINKESGTVFGSVNKKDISDLEIEIPSNPDEQRKIARYLSMLDDKIEINCKINNNLLKIATSIFNKKFPNISDGNKCIGDFISPKRGKNLLSKNAIPGDVPVVAGGLEPATYHNVSNTVSPVITISASGANAGYTNLWNIPVWSSDSSFIDASMTDNVYFWFIHLKSRQKEIFDSQTGSAQPHIYPKHISVMPIREIEMEDVENYTKIVTPLFDKIGINEKENNKLSELRDSLLPKLINGEILL